MTTPMTVADLRVPIDSVKPYPRNPRRGDVDAIKASLEQHGQYRPIVVNQRTQEVLAGNHTLTAARQLGWPDIAATYVDVDEDQAARIVLVDNRANDLAVYDDEDLTDLLRSLPGLEGTGYAEADLADLDALLSANEVLAPPEGDDNYVEQYGVIVVCRDEAHQAEMYDELQAKGLTVKVVTT